MHDWGEGKVLEREWRAAEVKVSRIDFTHEKNAWNRISKGEGKRIDKWKDEKCAGRWSPASKALSKG